MPRTLLVLTLVVLLPLAAYPLTLADGGRALATIMLPENPAPAERTAAKELSEHLQKITGAPFTVAEAQTKVSGARVLLGSGQVTRKLLGEKLVKALAPDEFIIKTVGRDLLLVGGSPRGTLYAVYSFLEDDLGCRWLTWYGDNDLPRRPKLELGILNRRGTPAFAVRDMCVQGCPGTLRPAVANFLARNRDQGPDMNFLGDLTAYGGTSHRYGLPPGIWMVHTLFGWIKPDKYFADHPEFFSLIGGQRRQAQLCFTNPELRRTMTANIIASIGATNPAGNYAVSAQDSDGPMCECEKCQALVKREGGAQGAPLFDYLCELGAAVKEKYPKAFLTTLAYRKSQTEKPPLTIKLPDNIIIIFAPIDDNFAQAIDHPSNADTLRNISEWPKHTSHLWVWYYPIPYGETLPLGSIERMAADFRLFHKIGVEGIFPEHDTGGVYRSLGLANLHTWLMLKLLWNPDRDVPALITDFTNRYYGAAAPLVREYSARLEAATKALPTRMSWNAPAGQYRHLTPELLVWSERLFDRAEAAVAADPVLLARVKQARLTTDLACVLNWGALKSYPDHGLNYQSLINRYRETYIAATREHIDPAYKGDELLKWNAALTDPKPLPAPLDQVPAERIRQFTPQTARLHGKGRIVADPAAACGIAAELDTDGKVPADMGYYDCLTKRQQHLYPGKDQPLVADKYRLYAIGRTKLCEQCYVWFDWSWLIQFADVAQYYDPAHPDKQWDIYASVKYEGAGYGGQGANRLRVDRVILVAAE